MHNVLYSLEHRCIARYGSVRACSSLPKAAAARGDLSRFIEQAGRSYLFERAVEQAKGATAGMDDVELTDIIDAAVQWARRN